jgi:hypothetical protein
LVFFKKYLISKYILYTYLLDDDYGVPFLFWTISQVVSSLYAFSWDILMDWSLFDLRSKNYLLRDHLVYSKNWVYYTAMVINFLLRSTWILIYSNKNMDIHLIMIIIAIGELVRRWIWNFFRIENEVDNDYFYFYFTN